MHILMGCHLHGLRACVIEDLVIYSEIVRAFSGKMQ